MVRLQPTWAALGLVVSFVGATASAGPITICSTQPNIDYECIDCPDGVKNLPIALFDFSGQHKLASITGIEFTLSAQTATPNQQINLGLNDITTGLELTGFQTDTLVEKNFSFKEGDAGWLTAEQTNQLLDAINSGDPIIASLIGQSAADLMLQLYSDTPVELCITGEAVPEPTTLAIWLAAVGILMVRRRRALARAESLRRSPGPAPS